MVDPTVMIHTCEVSDGWWLDGSLFPLSSMWDGFYLCPSILGRRNRAAVPLFSTFLLIGLHSFLIIYSNINHAVFFGLLSRRTSALYCLVFKVGHECLCNAVL
jgi:hypothetical protein